MRYTDQHKFTVKHLQLAAAIFGGFYKWTFWQIYILYFGGFSISKKKKKKKKKKMNPWFLT